MPMPATPVEYTPGTTTTPLPQQQETICAPAWMAAFPAPTHHDDLASFHTRFTMPLTRDDHGFGRHSAPACTNPAGAVSTPGNA